MAAYRVFAYPVPEFANPNHVVARLARVSGGLSVTLGGVSVAGAGTIPVNATAGLNLEGLLGGFPYVVDVTTSNDSVAGTSHTVALPSGIQNRDRLIVLITGGSSGSGVTFPSGWPELYDNTGAITVFAAAYRDCDGSESGPITVVSDNSWAGAFSVIRVRGWHGASAPEFSSEAVTTDTNPNPANLTPSWGAEQTLWIAAFGGLQNPPETISVYPYASNQTYVASSATGARGYMGLATTQVRAASENPGTFTISGADICFARTIAIRGATVGTASAPATGSANVTLDALTLSGTAAVLVLGSAALNLADVTMTGAGLVPVTSSLTVTFGDVTLSGLAAVTGGAGPPPVETSFAGGVGPMHWSTPEHEPPRRRLTYRPEPPTYRVFFKAGLNPPKVKRVQKEVWKPKAKKPEVTIDDDTAALLALLLALEDDD